MSEWLGDEWVQSRVEQGSVQKNDFLVLWENSFSEGLGEPGSEVCHRGLRILSDSGYISLNCVV